MAIASSKGFLWTPCPLPLFSPILQTKAGRTGWKPSPENIPAPIQTLQWLPTALTNPKSFPWSANPWSHSPAAPTPHHIPTHHAADTCSLSSWGRPVSSRLTTYTHSLRSRGRILWGLTPGPPSVCPLCSSTPVNTICNPQSLDNYAVFWLRENHSLSSWTQGAGKTPKESTIPKLNI